MTAVEYIEEYLINKGIIINDKTTPQVLVGVLNEAKEMEKQQLCYFYIKGAEAEINNPYVTNIEFYNKTFNK